MNLKLIKKSDEAFNIDEIKSISAKLDLPEKFVELLYMRGIVGEKVISKFLYPDEANFYDPFLMKGMTEAVARLNSAITNNERIVVYGDYDVDGVCSSAILSLYLASKGVEVYTHIPSRITDGYGLNIESVDRIIEECAPDLILTCDCGISGYKEVEEAKDLGVDVIVTDHHEVSEIIPDCIVINPHQTDCLYPFKQLCGAGVALKLVEAMGGIEAARIYWDLAAVATIADLVPLTDENRLLVQLGLKSTEEVRNLGLKQLLKSQNIEGVILSNDISFKVVPRLNAAGRMGDAYNAFTLLTVDDSETIDAIIADIDLNNERRKNLCAKLYDEAMIDIKNENIIDRRCIVLSHDDWEKGITGIIAARLAGEFNRPAFILVKSGNSYKGTARSISGINIYNLLSSLSDILCEYGGHSQAAGFSILPENLEKFKERAAEYLMQFPREYFEPSLTYDTEISESEINKKLIRCLDLLEPTGNGNLKPLFEMHADKLNVQLCKNNVLHTQIALGGLQILAFNNYNKNHFLITEGNKSFVIELQTNFFNGKEYVRGILRGLSIEKLTFNDDFAGAAFMKMAALSADKEAKFVNYSQDELGGLIGDKIYGTLLICGCKQSYERFINNIKCDNIILHEFLFASSRNNYSRIIVSPEFDDDLCLPAYEKIIFLDSPISDGVISYINERTTAEVFVPKDPTKGIMESVSLDRSDFAYYYDAFKRFKDVKAGTLWGYYKALSSRVKVNLKQFVACLMVFIDLGFISIPAGEFAIKFNKNIKADLNTSAVYNSYKTYKG